MLCINSRASIYKSHLSQIICYDRITLNDYIYFLILDNHILVMLILSLWATEQNYFRLKCFFDTPHIMLLSYCCCFYRYFIVQDIKVDKHMLRWMTQAKYLMRNQPIRISNQNNIQYFMKSYDYSYTLQGTASFPYYRKHF